MFPNTYRNNVAFQDRLRALEGVGAEDLTLSLCGAPLEDSCLVSELSSSELDLTVPLLGGKVHGSLARAGEYLCSGFFMSV